jgi:hypothetical protein
MPKYTVAGPKSVVVVVPEVAKASNPFQEGPPYQKVKAAGVGEVF